MEERSSVIDKEYVKASLGRKRMKNKRSLFEKLADPDLNPDFVAKWTPESTRSMEMAVINAGDMVLKIPDNVWNRISIFDHQMGIEYFWNDNQVIRDSKFMAFSYGAHLDIQQYFGFVRHDKHLAGGKGFAASNDPKFDFSVLLVALGKHSTEDDYRKVKYYAFMNPTDESFDDFWLEFPTIQYQKNFLSSNCLQILSGYFGAYEEIGHKNILDLCSKIYERR